MRRISRVTSRESTARSVPTVAASLEVLPMRLTPQSALPSPQMHPADGKAMITTHRAQRRRTVGPWRALLLCCRAGDPGVGNREEASSSGSRARLYPGSRTRDGDPCINWHVDVVGGVDAHSVYRCDRTRNLACICRSAPTRSQPLVDSSAPDPNPQPCGVLCLCLHAAAHSERPSSRHDVIPRLEPPAPPSRPSSHTSTKPNHAAERRRPAEAGFSSIVRLLSRLAKPVSHAGQWQWKNSFTDPSGRSLECSTVWFVTFDPSEPTRLTLNVNVPLVVVPLALKPPQTAKVPV